MVTIKKESTFLAEKIYEIENMTVRQVKEKNLDKSFLIQDSYSLDESIVLTRSSDYMVWYLWKTYPDQVRPFFKVVPKVNYPKEKIEQLLDMQAWVCV